MIYPFSLIFREKGNIKIYPINITDLIIASNNPHKVEEIKNILSGINVRSLKDANVFIEVEEDGATLEENAFKKAKEIFDVTGTPVLADDTGLFVEALNGDPGVYSARYAGENVSYTDNCNKLIRELKKHDLPHYPAYFKSVICFVISETEHYFFEGVIEGAVITEPCGTNGFGYDPLFIPEGYTKTFAELSDYEKNLVSHRALALNKFKKFISQ